MKLVLALLLLLPASAEVSRDEWDSLAARVRVIDDTTSGNLGLFMRRIGDGRSFSHEADRYWYLSSTTKVPIAVALLKEVEAGRISLAEKLTLQRSDFVDGAGELQFKKPGTAYSIAFLLEKMLVQSDSSATDMLIRRLGEKKILEFLETQGGFQPFTTLLQVRYDAYGELHPRAGKLTNLDFMALKKEKDTRARRLEFARLAGVPVEELRAPTLEEAFERYYLRNLNSSTLTGYGGFLERLAKGELLDAKHTALVLGHMKSMTTGEHRIKAGLPEGTIFAQKTGTQVKRICNVGIVDPEGRALVVVACVEKFGSQPEAEAALKRVGQAIGTML